MQTFALRLQPGQDLKQELTTFAVSKQLQAGFVLSAIGSLQQATLRFANQPTGTTLAATFEILSLNGTLSVNGSHLHTAIADSTGNVIGGHLMNGCIIYTTAEIIIGELSQFTFMRSPDSHTGFLELDIKERSTPDD